MKEVKVFNLSTYTSCPYNIYKYKSFKEYSEVKLC